MRLDRLVFSFASLVALAVVACSSSGSGSADAGTQSTNPGGGTSGNSGGGNGGSGNTGGSGNPGGGGGGDTGSSSGGQGTAGTSDGGGGGQQCPTSSEADCKNAGSQCLNCCSCFHQHGVTTFDQSIANCACQASVCRQQCANSLCAQNPTSPSQGDACDNCVNAALQPDAGAGCMQQVVIACNADRDCVGLLQCVNGSNSGGSGCP
jgi:hypothetical protein